MYEEVLLAIGKLSFRIAKSMPQWPHEYTVRNHEPTLHEAYLTLYRAIERHGIAERFSGTKRPSMKLYLYPGDGYRYWFENPSPQTSKIINRNTIENADKLRKAGLIS
jgi:hypothetical protein